MRPEEDGFSLLVNAPDRDENTCTGILGARIRNEMIPRLYDLQKAL
jgi:hypothetical protein